jgi:hypothetical protein
VLYSPQHEVNCAFSSTIYAMEDIECAFLYENAQTLPPQHRKRLLSLRDAAAEEKHSQMIEMCCELLPEITNNKIGHTAVEIVVFNL